MSSLTRTKYFVVSFRYFRLNRPQKSEADRRRSNVLKIKRGFTRSTATTNVFTSVVVFSVNTAATTSARLFRTTPCSMVRCGVEVDDVRSDEVLQHEVFCVSLFGRPRLTCSLSVGKLQDRVQASQNRNPTAVKLFNTLRYELAVSFFTSFWGNFVAFFGLPQFVSCYLRKQSKID